jgi:hypothetical protein
MNRNRIPRSFLHLEAAHFPRGGTMSGFLKRLFGFGPKKKRTQPARERRHALRRMRVACAAAAIQFEHRREDAERAAPAPLPGNRLFFGPAQS